MKLANNLHRIGSDHVNCYLVADADGITVIDAGLPGQWKELEAELAGMGRSARDIRGLVLTHGDTDHIGFAERLRQQLGVEVYVHELDATRARREGKQPNGAWGRVRLRPLASFLGYAVRRGGLRIPPVAEVTTFGDDQTLALPGEPRIICVPGHTPGSVAVHVPAVDALFVGDALTTGNVLTGEQGPRPAPFTLDADVALDSLSRLESVQAAWVLPGHGAPWRGAPADAVRQVRDAAGR